MTRIQLEVTASPPEARVYCTFEDARTGASVRVLAVVDTGAQVSLFPLDLLERISARETEVLEIEQAGIAGLHFTAREAWVQLDLEDRYGARVTLDAVLAWFTQTDKVIVGFNGVLDHAVLHLDMPARDGWLEFASPITQDA